MKLQDEARGLGEDETPSNALPLDSGTATIQSKVFGTGFGPVRPKNDDSD